VTRVVARGRGALVLSVWRGGSPVGFSVVVISGVAKVATNGSILLERLSVIGGLRFDFCEPGGSLERRTVRAALDNCGKRVIGRDLISP
jgi:hypothetical protein